LLTATFPAGTVSGAPKIRAMEIINELENIKRTFYAGGVGYIGYSGNLDLAIAIRTMLIKNKKFFIQAGAGIVNDSVPENEYYECMNKAKSLFKAIKFAEEGLK
jgi:anthranilate synthase component I